MRKAIQRLFSEIGESACYALSIIKHAETITKVTFNDGMVLNSLVSGITWGFIYYNWDNPADNDNFLVLDAGAFLSRLTGETWTCIKTDASYIAQIGELVTAVWERRKASGTVRHFANPDYDPLGNSLTIAQGTIVGYRVFRKRNA